MKSNLLSYGSRNPAFNLANCVFDPASLLDVYHPGLMSCSSPRMNILREENCVRVEVDVPGYKAEDLKVEIENVESRRVLNISGSLSTDISTDKVNWIVQEVSRSSFARSYTLPSDLSLEDPTVELKDGVLRLTFKTKPLTATQSTKVIPIS